MANEVDKYKEFLANEVATAQIQTLNELSNSKQCLLATEDQDNRLKFIQKQVENLKHAEQRITSRIQRLKNIGPQAQYVQQLQSQPQLIYQQPGQQETPNLSEGELRTLAIPVICNNWESKWEELMRWTTG